MSRGPRHPLAYDVTRLASRIFSRTPNGIDRVDMAYARHFLDQGEEGDCGVLFLGPLGMRRLERVRAQGVIEQIAVHFGERAKTADEDLLRAVAGWTAGHNQPGLATARTVKLRRSGWLPVARFTQRTIRAAGQRVASALPQNARYLCVSQFPLSEPGAYRWLAQRPDVRPVFFIHDLLPLQYPEYFKQPELARHQRRLTQLAEVGAAALVSTRTVGEALSNEMKRLGRPDFPVHISPMPLAAGFSPAPVSRALAGARPYFIQLGTIEPRKNHLCILHVWRELATMLGPGTPKLILAGARGWENENILDLLDRSPAIRDHVLELGNADTPTLAELIRGARALLMPSFAEGYGLPLAEALALGVPAIASDIPVFHDVASGHFRAVHPLDGPGWISAILNALDMKFVETSSTPPTGADQGDAFQNLREFLDTL